MHRTGPKLFLLLWLLGLSCSTAPPSGPPQPDEGRSDLAGDARPLLCQRGSTSCDGPQAVRCSEDGLRWIAAEKCAPSQLCQLGTCRDRCGSPVKAILSFATPWHGSPLAENLLIKDVVAALLGGEQAVLDLVPGRVDGFQDRHPICAPRYGVAGTGLGMGLVGECAAGFLLLQKMGYPENDGLVPLASALPKQVTSFGTYRLDHFSIIREERVAGDVVRQIKAVLGTASGSTKLILINGLTGGHQVSDEALREAITGFGASNVIFCPTDSSMALSYTPVGSDNLLVVGTRGLFSAGMESLEAQSQYVAAKIALLQKQGFVKPEDSLLLVGHSMGGLAAYGATYLLEHGLTRFNP